MDAKCARCHVPGSFTPFSLKTYEEARPHLEAVRAAVASGHMPPWKFDDNCNEYRGNYGLTPTEKQMLLSWIAEGGVAGDPATEGPALDIDDRALSRVDATLTVPAEYTPQQRPDEYRCFPVRWPEAYTTTKYMTGFRAVPGNVKIVHHMEIYRVEPQDAQLAFNRDNADPGPGYTCFGGPGVGTGTIGGWAPGSQGYDYPGGTGIAIRPGSVLIIQVHYNTLYTAPAPDRSSVQFKVDDTAIPGGYNFWTNPRWAARQMPIAAGNPDVSHTYSADPTYLTGGPMNLWGGAVHMHTLGKSGQLSVRRANGSTECVLLVPDWDFHWQSGVQLRQPIRVNPGDQISLNCHFDNSAANQPIVNGIPQPPRAVNWGEGTQDEMCLGIIMWGPAR
jgi:hypothetical protein